MDNYDYDYDDYEPDNELSEEDFLAEMGEDEEEAIDTDDNGYPLMLAEDPDECQLEDMDDRQME